MFGQSHQGYLQQLLAAILLVDVGGALSTFIYLPESGDVCDAGSVLSGEIIMASSIESIHLTQLHVVREEPHPAQLDQLVLEPGELPDVSLLLPGQRVDPADTGLSDQADPGLPLLVKTGVVLSEDGGHQAWLGPQHLVALG